MKIETGLLVSTFLLILVSTPQDTSARVVQTFSKSLPESQSARDPAQPCVESQCKLPDCRCAETDIPGGLSTSDTPQIVAISFDDGVRVIDYESYYSKVFNGRKNPNGCPIGLTLFVSHDYTDYALVEDLHYT